MKSGTRTATLLAAAMIVGCTTSSSQTVTVPLNATPRNGGQIANATLAVQGNETAFSFVVSGVPSGTLALESLHLYQQRQLRAPGTVAYAMNDRINTNRISATRGWTYSRSAPVTLAELLSGGYYLVIRTTPADGNVDIFCGDIKPETR